MQYQPKIELAETLERARRGDAQASRELLSHHCKVWTYEELKALNCYRKGKDTPKSYQRYNSSSTYYVKKDFQSKPEITTVVWYEPFDNEYDLYSLVFSDGTNQLWMFRNKPICNVTDWTDRDTEEEGKPKTKSEKKMSKVFIKSDNKPWNRR